MSSQANSISDRLAEAWADRHTRVGLILAGVAAVVLSLGLIYYWQHTTAQGESLSAGYGRRRGSGADSVNGTSVLADMFESEGFEVRTVERLSPRLEKEVDVIVWFPSGYSPPTDKQREFLEHWLADGFERTLIYVGRDYDAAPHYWQAIRPLSPQEDLPRIDKLSKQAEKARGNYGGVKPDERYNRWFTIAPGTAERKIKTLSGPWAEGVDAAAVEIPLRDRLVQPAAADAGDGDPLPPENIELLLAGDGSDLAFREKDYAWSDSQVIVVANGSFLLNYPLINKEHRKLAGRLIDECGAATSVAFIESGDEGPEVLDKDPPQTGGLTLLRIWPLNAIVVHLTMLGIVLCLARWPIFGRPKELPAETPADFGRHVTALGQLLARTKNLTYAQQRLAQYQQQARRGSGASHRT